MDEDLAEMTRDHLITEVKKLRQGNREHRDSSGHELCWHHPALRGALTREDRSCSHCSGVAAIHARVCQVLGRC